MSINVHFHAPLFAPLGRVFCYRDRNADCRWGAAPHVGPVCDGSSHTLALKLSECVQWYLNLVNIHVVSTACVFICTKYIILLDLNIFKEAYCKTLHNRLMCLEVENKHIFV